MTIHVHKLTEDHCCWNHDLRHAVRENRLTPEQAEELMYDLEKEESK